MRRIAIAAIVAGCAAFGACGGGGGGGTSVPGGPGAAAPPTATPTPVPTSAAGTAAVTFQIEIPLTTRGTSALRRGVKYVSPGTESIAISVNGASPQVFSATTPGGPIAGCSTPSSNQPVVSCNWTLQVPPGPATFAVTLCSGTNGTGSILSQGSTSATIALGKPNDVAITFNGVPHALVLQLGTVAPPAGTASVISVVVYVVDAAGYAIVGPGTGTTATLTDTDPTSATYLYAPASNGACGTAPGGNTKSLAVTTGGLVNACLAYDGASSPSTITLDATANGLSEATAAMSPSGAQPTSAAVWTLAQPVYQNISGVVTPAPSPAILDAFDENVTTNAAPLVHISGDQTQIPDLTYASTYGPATVGLAADAKGDISIAYGHEIITFAPGSNGNVPPSAVTTFPSLSSVQSLSGLVYDASGNAYFAAVVGGASSCTLYRASIVNGSETPTTIGDCTHPLKNVTYSYATVGGLAFDSKGDLLVGFAGLPSGGQSSQSLVVRYVPNGGGSYVPSGAIAVKDLNDSEIPIPSVDAAGDITTYPYTYPGTSFVDDSVQTPNALAERNAFGLGFGEWAPNGSIFVLEQIFSEPGQLRRYTSDSGAVQPSTSAVATITSNDLGYAVALAVGPSPGTSSGTALIVRPSSLSFNGAGSSDQATETVSETSYTGSVTQQNTCSGIATVTPSSGAAPATFTVTATGPGSCTITYADSHSNTATSNVVVTTTTLTGQAMKRR